MKRGSGKLAPLLSVVGRAGDGISAASATTPQESESPGLSVALRLWDQVWCDAPWWEQPPVTPGRCLAISRMSDFNEHV